MKKTIKGYVLGFITATLLITGIGYAANTTTLYDVITNGVKIVIDGQKLNPTDANGNTVEPIIYNGTTYLPVRAVANAFGKAVYWDGPNYTVYLGNMDGKLEYPTKEISINENIGGQWWVTSSDLRDNYGNNYTNSIHQYWSTSQYDAVDGNPYEILCNMKYSKFKGTIYVENGYSGNDVTQIVIKADGKTVYTSPEITKTSAPIYFDVNITGCNDLKIINTKQEGFAHIGDAGFYQ